MNFKFFSVILVIVCLFFFCLFFFSLFFIINFFMAFRAGGFVGSSSFESGFQRIGLVQNSFRVQFFMILLLFVVFDLEIVLFAGVLVCGNFSFFIFFFIFFFVTLGVYLEWYFNKLC